MIITTLLFIGSAALTIVWCTSMSEMRGMAMPGGWTMSMAWMRMPGQTWPGAAASFLGMWVVMMVAMMLPSFTPMLWRYRQAVGGALVGVGGAAVGATGKSRLAAYTALATLGYFVVWTMAGAIVYPLGVMLAEIEMRQPAVSRVVPMAAGLVVLIAGALQFTAWKAHQLSCCREAGSLDTTPAPARAGAAWRYGLHAGLHCFWCCAGPMAVLLVMGVMDLTAMAIVTVVITAERLAPAGHRVARFTGAIAIVTGLYLIVRATMHFA